MRDPYRLRDSSVGTSARLSVRLFPKGISLAEELAIRTRCIRELSATVKPKPDRRPLKPASVRREGVLSGAGMLAVARRFIFEGADYLPGITRVVPDHPCVRAMGPQYFRAAKDGDRDPQVVRALRPDTARPSKRMWRLP